MRRGLRGPSSRRPPTQLVEQHRTELGDVACAEGENEIPGLEFFGQPIYRRFEIADKVRVSMAMLSNLVTELASSDTLDRIFTGRVNLGDQKTIRIVESRGKLFQTISGPAVSVWLKDRPNSLSVETAGRL